MHPNLTEMMKSLKINEKKDFEKQKFGISFKKEENFPDWYSQVLLQGNMHDYYDIKGCFILRPQSMFIWNEIRKYFTSEIEKLGVQECYFPLLITKSAIEKEKKHIENFAPELAWITKAGETELNEPVAIRPTSETVMYPSFAKWIRSHRDLPLRLNQWCNVLRWEVKSTLPFIRGREFLWQEGHSAFLTKKEAEEEVLDILNLYEKIYVDLLAVPVLRGIKSENEKFGGADYSRSVESFIPETGRGIQAATSHYLGQNFSKMFEIRVEDGNGNLSLVHQNSWGLTTRSIGIAVMIHSDNSGLVLPPRVSMYQVVIVPCGMSSKQTDEERERLKNYIEKVKNELKGIRVHLDDRENYLPGFKFNYWELQGVPLRMEVGFRDLEKEIVTIVRRIDRKKIQIKIDVLNETIKRELDQIHNEMYENAKTKLYESIVEIKNIEELNIALSKKKIGKGYWCGKPECEENIKAMSTVKENDVVLHTGAKSMCVLENHKNGQKCFGCDEIVECIAVFGRTY